MNNRHDSNGPRFTSALFAAALTASAFVGSALAADISADSLKLAAGVTKATEGYETPASTNYVVANPTNVFSNHFYYDTKVTGELKRGEAVRAMAKVKGYDWVLVDKGGTAIGYVPVSMLAPEGQYHP